MFLLCLAAVSMQRELYKTKVAEWGNLRAASFSKQGFRA